MTLRASKPTFNVREKLTELGRRFGLKGSELMRAETVQDVRNLINSGRKNYIINGDFKVWQRGTSGGVGTGNRTYRSADRWFNFNAGDTTSQLDLSSVNIGGVTGRFRYGMRVSGSQSSRILGQCIEGPLPAGDYVFSAWVRFSEIPKNFYMTHNSTALTGENNFAGWYGGSGTAVSYTNPDNVGVVSQTGVWYHVYKKFTAISPHLGLGIAFQPVFGSSTTATMDITGVQVERVESGTKPTNFEHRSYGEELALCQRYYQKNIQTSGQYTVIFTGSNYSSTTVYGAYHLQTPMRTPPTSMGYSSLSHFSIINTSGSTNPNPTVLGIDNGSGTQTLRVYATASGLSAGQGAFVQMNNASAYIDFSAEL